MVKIVLALVALTAVANAEEPDDSPAFNMFGFRMSAGALPLDGGTTTLSVGLGVEHPVFQKTRVFGEYEWLWLVRDDDRMAQSGVMRPDPHGNGHRASAGLRRELVAKNLSHMVRVFLDGELGGGFAIANDNLNGLELVPSGLVGLRFGYDIYSRSDDSPSRTFELELLVRAVAIQGGAGALFGMGMLWGN